MVALHVYFVLLVVSVDTAHGEIPNEIRQFVLSLLKEHDGEVIELKQEILTLRQEVSSLQSSYLKVLHELDDIRRKEEEEVSVPMETKMDDQIRKHPIKNLSPQSVTKSNASQNSTAWLPTIATKTLKHTRKGRYISRNRIPYDVLSVKIYMYMIKKSYFRIQYTYILNPILKLQQLFTFSNFM